MKKYRIVILLVISMLLVACGNEVNEEDEQKLKVVSTFTIISDMAEQIGQDLVEVYNLVPTGTDPHEYEPMPNDIKAATDADILFYNGMNLEGGEEGWFMKMVDSVNQNIDNIYNLNVGVTPHYLMEGDSEEEINPHSFIDPQVGIQMVENMTEALIEKDPNNAQSYDDNADDYLQRLNEVDQNYKDVIDNIPEENKILVTSEKAFQYMTDRYGLREASVWEIDTEELGTTAQLKALITLLKEDTPPYLFLESNVDPKPLEQVSKETGVPIFEEYIYSDEIGKKGAEVDTYMKFLNHNIKIIEKGLNPEK